MSFSRLLCSDAVRLMALRQGACGVAVARVRPVDSEAVELYERWTASGCHASMLYLEKYPDLRANPSLLLDGARSMVCCAFAYRPAPPGMASRIAGYALGDDYHEAVRRRLEIVAAQITETYGGQCRVCVDTAPLRERYWATRSGLGLMGLNNHLIVPGAGSCVLLGEILTTVELEPDVPLAGDCGRCGKCVAACPTGALRADGSLDARKCLSYLTIEHRGEFPDGTDLHGTLYGCDRCGAVCPHNAHAGNNAVVPELEPRPELLTLTAQECADMTQERFSSLFRNSAIKRAKLAGLRRNARLLLKNQ